MRKCLLVTLIGIVIAMNLYGMINELISMLEAKEIDKGYTIVYME